MLTFTLQSINKRGSSYKDENLGKLLKNYILYYLLCKVAFVFQEVQTFSLFFFSEVFVTIIEFLLRCFERKLKKIETVSRERWNVR